MATRPRSRLDVWLVAHGLATSREKAQALIMAGRVCLDGQPAAKAGAAVREEAEVTLRPGPEHVGRGALKLMGALDVFAVDPAGRVAIDIGASTGGFSEVLLARGATRVYAVDVGRAQLHEKLRLDPRVRSLEGLNARQLSVHEIPEPCQVATMDVSFISVLKLLPALRAVLAPEADVVVLVKPQFELTRRDVGRNGIVREAALHRRALEGVARSAQQTLGYAVLNACASPIAGAEGNREFFLHLRPQGASLPDERWEEMIAGATKVSGP
jgi:23S rRNA (cytidine1920-2'-O)/16S rRNA (cytidine1409-2'-O)-methyltransferase